MRRRVVKSKERRGGSVGRGVVKLAEWGISETNRRSQRKKGTFVWWSYSQASTG